MNNENFFKIISIVSFFIIVIPSVYSFGISPSKTNVNFFPNINVERYFKIINQEKMSGSAQLSVSGELSPYIILQNKTIPLYPNQSESKVYFRIQMPSTYETGLHTARINIVPKSNSQGALSAIISLNHNINLHVPPEYSQLFLNFSYSPPFLILLLKNPRNETINSVNLKLILNNRTIKIDNLKFQSEETKKIIKKIKLIKNGKYLITYFVSSEKFNFSGKRKILVGKREIKFKLDIKNDLKAGQINKIPVELENQWNENIHTTINISLRKAAKIYTTSKKTIDLKPYEKKIIDIYLESQNVNKGNYTLSTKLSYDEMNKQIDQPITLKTPLIIKPNEDSLNKLKMSALIMTLLLLGILLYLMWRKK